MENLKTDGLNQKLIQEICALARKYNIEKVILFGSRARGDFKRTSDIDIAASGGNVAAFSLDLDEVTPTLLKYDVINMEEHVQEELLASIKTEGIILYEKD